MYCGHEILQNVGSTASLCIIGKIVHFLNAYFCIRENLHSTNVLMSSIMSGMTCQVSALEIKDSNI